jgi:pyrroline-5-carboxylate reductase
VSKRLGFIGVGNISEAVISGLLKAGRVRASQVYGTVARESSIPRVRERLGIHASIDNALLAKESDIIFLAVKWDALDAVLSQISEFVTKEKVIISLVGAMSTAFIEERLRAKVPVILAIPNSACAVRTGFTLISRGAYVSDSQLESVENIFGSLGKTQCVDKRTIDTFQALTSSGPAFFYSMVEAIAEAGIKLGLEENAAQVAAAQTMLGSAQMVLESNQAPAVLREKITTPGGCTIAGLNELDKWAFKTALQAAIEATVSRSRELRKSMGTD